MRWRTAHNKHRSAERKRRARVAMLTNFSRSMRQLGEAMNRASFVMKKLTKEYEEKHNAPIHP